MPDEQATKSEGRPTPAYARGTFRGAATCCEIGADYQRKTGAHAHAFDHPGDCACCPVCETPITEDARAGECAACGWTANERGHGR